VAVRLVALGGSDIRPTATATPSRVRSGTRAGCGRAEVLIAARSCGVGTRTLGRKVDGQRRAEVDVLINLTSRIGLETRAATVA
jgi:hypothetical protein